MFCYNCSQEVITGSRFCHKCGSEIGEMKNQSVADQTKPGARANTCAKRPVQSALMHLQRFSQKKGTFTLQPFQVEKEER